MQPEARLDVKWRGFGESKTTFKGVVSSFDGDSSTTPSVGPG